MNPTELAELEALKRLKYAYLRCIDLKLWDELGQYFTEDATVAYADGRWSGTGRDHIVTMLEDGLGADVITCHTVHHPELDLTSPTTAVGTWMLEDWVYNRRTAAQLHGGAHYRDEYRKVDGRWLIAYTGYQRTFEHRTPLDPDSLETP